MEQKIEKILQFLNILFLKKIEDRIVENVAIYDKNIYYYVGIICDKKRQNDKGIEYYRKAVETIKDKDKWLICIYNLCDLLILSFKSSEAIQLAPKLLPDDPDAYFLLGDASMRIGKTLEAIEYLKKGIEQGSSKCIKDLAIAYSTLKDNKTENIRQCVDLCKLYIEKSEKLLSEKSLSEKLLSEQSSSDSSSITKITSSIKRYYAKILEIYDMYLFNSIDYIEYTTCYDKSDISILTSITQYNIGFSFYIKMNDIKRAIDVFTKLISQYNDCDAKNMLAEIYEKQGDLQKAYDLYIESAIGKNGKNENSYASCSYLLRKMNLKPIDTDEDKEKYEKCLKSACAMHTHYNQKRINCLPDKNATFPVRLDYLSDLFKKIDILQSQLNEYDLRPPLEGGRIYTNMKKNFDEKIKIISL